MHPRAYRLIFPDPGSSTTPSALRVRPASVPPRGPGPQTALVFEPRELWIAMHVPQLSLLALQSATQTAPQVVVDPDDPHQRVIDADAQACEAGVRPGMTLGAALAAAPDIVPRAREAVREHELLQRLAAVAARFTPQVSIEPPDGLVLEIKPSVNLFGGLRPLCRRLREACRAEEWLAQTRVEPHFTLAPTALAALAAARAGARCFITDPAALAARLKPLPVTVLRWPDEHIQRLAAMGVRTLGELLRLPRAGFARRFSPALLADLDRLLGKRADPRARLLPRERYRGALDLDHEIDDHERVLQALAPLLAELEQFLRARQRGITALQCRFHHYRAAPTRCTLRLAAPEASAERFTQLLRERLATVALPEPVRRCELRGGTLTQRALVSRHLWSPGEHGHGNAGEMPALVEHLRARLGAEAVYGIRRVSEHRPENAWRVSEPALQESAATEVGDTLAHRPFGRPTWLLAAPLALDAPRGWPRHGGPLELLTGPERIESGWWDGGELRRDYYVARDPHGARLWIYCEFKGEFTGVSGNGAGARRWFLHGIFG